MKRAAKNCSRIHALIPLIPLVATLVIVAPRIGNSYSLKYSDTGETIRWHRSRVPVRIDNSLDETIRSFGATSTLLDALSTWENSGFLPLEFQVSPTDDAQIGFFEGQENSNDILANDGPWPFADSYTAVTITTYDVETGEIVDSDIIINADRSWSTHEGPASARIDLLDTATHEVGHLLGLDHSNIAEATMFASGPPGQVERRTLHQDDLDALIAVYGAPPRLGRLPYTGCGATGSRPQEHSLFLLALGIVLFLLRRGKIC